MSIEFSEIQDQMLPDAQIETDWAGGVIGLPTTTKRLLLVGTSANLNGEVHRITDLSDAVSKYGEGSTLACMIEAALRTSPKATIYAMSLAAGSGSATKEVLFAGTSTAAGSIKIWVGGRLLEVGIATGQNAAAVEASVVAAATAHGQYNWPALITQGPTGAGYIDATAVSAGKCGNGIRFRIDVSNLAGITVDSVQIKEYPLAGGTTATNPTTPLATIQGSRYHLIAIESEDATAATALKTHCALVSGVSVKNWAIGIVPCITGSSACQTLTASVDSFRMQVVGLENSPRPIFEVAATFGALRATKDPRQECDDDVLSHLMTPFDPADWPTPGDAEADLDLGVTPLMCAMTGGKVFVSRSIISAQSATLANSKAQDATIHEKSDYVDESIIARYSAYKGKTFKAEGEPGRPNTITPTRATAILLSAMKLLDTEDYIQKTNTYNAEGKIVAEANATNPDRVDCAFPFHPTRSLHFIALKKTYTY